jgi:hypothetical protein
MVNGLQCVLALGALRVLVVLCHGIARASVSLDERGWVRRRRRRRRRRRSRNKVIHGKKVA